MIYISIWMFLLLSNFVKKNKKKIIFFVGMFLLVLISFFRYEIGWDYNSYKATLINLNINHEYERFEPINKLIIQISRKINLIPIFFGIYSILNLFFIYSFIEKNSLDKIFSLFLFYMYDFGFLGTFSAIRSFLAISIICFGLKYIYKKEIIKYFIIVLTATLIHTGAIIGIVFYFLYNLKLNIYTYSLFLIPFIGIEKLISIIPFLQKYEIYLSMEENSKYMKYIMLFYTATSFFLITFLKDQKLKFLNTIVFLGGTCGYFYAQIPGLNRISSYLLIYLIIYIPNLISKIRDFKLMLFLKIFIISITSVMFFYLLRVHYKSQQDGKIIPYKTFIGEEIQIK